VTIKIAHRGASGYLPEHTLQAASYAHALGADYIEQDVVLSKDSIPVVLHDIYLNSVTNVKHKYSDRKRRDGNWYVSDFTLSELKELSVNERLHSNGIEAVYPNRFPINKGNFQVSTLSEHIELIQGLNASTMRNVGIYPEIKRPKWHRKEGLDISKITVDLLKQYGYSNNEDKIFLQCFDSKELKRIKNELTSSLPLIQLIGSNSWGESEDDFSYMISENGIKEVSKYAVGIGPYLQLNYNVSLKSRDFTPSQMIKYARQNNLLIHPYTIRKDSIPLDFKNFEEMVKWFINILKADGIFTDFVDLTKIY
tara:strand:+ start:842 stop:1771 length:930 start_codon:yes stop_codon:yes gene_type:complete